MNYQRKVFLGGTCNGSKWREFAEKKLKLPSFNPVVEHWDENARIREEEEKKQCVYQLYVLTPKMEGCYSVAELINNCHQDGYETYFCFLEKDGEDTFSEHQVASLRAVGNMVESLGGVYTESLEEIINHLNQHA